MASDDPINFGALRDLVGYQLRRAFLRSNKLFTRLGAEAGVAPGQYGVLKLVGLNPGRSQSDIAQAAGLDPSSLTQLLDQLATRGLIERRPGRDRRQISLHLTQDGARAVLEATDKVLEHEQIIRAKLSDDEARQLVELLSRIDA